MRRVKSFDEFVNENLKAAIGSPIKYTKIKNNLKKFQQTKVQQSLNNVDFEKKKQKGTLDPKAKDTLAAANKAKNIKDKTNTNIFFKSISNTKKYIWIFLINMI